MPMRPDDEPSRATTSYFVIVTWREGEASLFSLSQDRFTRARRAWIDEGFHNLQTEWLERRSEGGLPHRFCVFVYWEPPDDAPSIDLLRDWGRRATKLPLTP